MQVRLQVLENDQVVLDAYQPARTDFAGLHGLLIHEKVQYDPTRFVRRGDWVQFTSNGTTYRAMSSRRFG